MTTDDSIIIMGLQSPFEQLREIDADGKELRKSYTLC